MNNIIITERRLGCRHGVEVWYGWIRDHCIQQLEDPVGQDRVGEVWSWKT